MCSGEPALVPSGLRGYRMWHLRGGELCATSVLHGSWEAGELTAACRRLVFAPVDAQRHEAPDAACNCGIYGWYRPTEARLHHGAVFGVIEAAGRVLLGDFGFRAERARILALCVPEEWSDTPARAVAFAQQWERKGVRVFGSREALLAEFQPEDVTELLGHPIPDPDAVVPSALLMSLNIDINGKAKAFNDAMKQLVKTMAQATASARELQAALATAQGNPPLPDDPKERALALRKQGHRGPEKKRRGRARLSL